MLIFISVANAQTDLVFSTAQFSSLASSQDLRSTKKFQIAAGAGVDYTTFGRQAEFGYYINSDFLVGLKYSVSMLEGEGSQEVYSALGIFNRIFLSNSFYIQPILFFRSYENSQYQGENYTVRQNDSGEFSDYGLSATIGNQWQHQNFTIGIDWIGFSKALSLSSGEYWISPEGKSMGENFQISFLNLRIGLSF